jgi:hypothetical protein
MTNTKAFQVAVAGSDDATITRAQRLSRQLAAELEPDLALNSYVWSFQSFADQQVLKDAARRASKADVIIIAGNSASEPPPPVKKWIEASLAQKRKGVTAVVPYCGEEGDTPSAESPLCSYLRRITTRWGMDFLTKSPVGWQHNFEFLGGSPDGLAR